MNAQAQPLAANDKDISLEFTPVTSLSRMFLAEVYHRYIFVLGPIGSTKTTSCLFFLLKAAAQQAPSPDGIRRTRFGLIRNTLVALKQTVLKDILSLFAGVAEWRPSDNVVRFRIADIESDWMLLPLETPEDQRRLLSLQLTAIYINEVREVDLDLVFAAFTRTGRFPSAKHGGVGVTHRFCLADSNMGVENSRLHQFLEPDNFPELTLKRPVGRNPILYVHQPSATSPRADWLKYLPENYYDDVMLGATQAWIDTHVHAKWSHDLAGEPIFAGVFRSDFHVSTKTLQPIENLPLLVGMDVGFNPAAVICQLSHRGQLRVYKELSASNMLFAPFLDEMLRPALTLPGYFMRRVQIVVDPSAITRHAATGVSAFGVLKAKGFKADLAGTNDVEPRIRGIERFLVELRGSDDRGNAVPAVIIDPSCTVLINGLSGQYRYKRKKLTLELEDTPEKKHPISDVMDAFGYVTVQLSNGKFAREAGSSTMPQANLKFVHCSSRAWT